MRYTPLLVATPLVALTIWALWPGDERERARSLPERAAAAFEAGRIADCLDLFDPDFHDESATQRIDRDTIRAVMLGAMRTRRSPVTVHIGEGSAVLESFDAAAGTARVRCELVATRAAAAAGGDGAASWAVAVDAELLRGADGEWRFLRSEHRTLAGRAPYR